MEFCEYVPSTSRSTLQPGEARLDNNGSLSLHIDDCKAAGLIDARCTVLYSAQPRALALRPQREGEIGVRFRCRGKGNVYLRAGHVSVKKPLALCGLDHGTCRGLYRTQLQEGRLIVHLDQLVQELPPATAFGGRRKKKTTGCKTTGYKPVPQGQQTTG